MSHLYRAQTRGAEGQAAQRLDLASARGRVSFLRFVFLGDYFWGRLAPSLGTHSRGIARIGYHRNVRGGAARLPIHP